MGGGEGMGEEGWFHFAIIIGYGGSVWSDLGL